MQNCGTEKLTQLTKDSWLTQFPRPPSSALSATGSYAMCKARTSTIWYPWYSHLIKCSTFPQNQTVVLFIVPKTGCPTIAVTKIRKGFPIYPPISGWWLVWCVTRSTDGHTVGLSACFPDPSKSQSTASCWGQVGAILSVRTLRSINRPYALRALAIFLLFAPESSALNSFNTDTSKSWHEL